MAMSLNDVQALIAEIYGAKDARRGIDGTFMWFSEEVGELAGALRNGSPQDIAYEFADVQVWLATLANLAGVNLADAVAKKYGVGCPECMRTPCECGPTEKP